MARALFKERVGVGDQARRTELGNFLRVHRLAVSPEEVGLPRRVHRRRTRGLRREDVAECAAISTSWYTWLEQGRDIRVSEDVLDRIAGALLLDGSQREYLFALARRRAGGACPAPAEPPLDSLQRLLDNHLPNPGYVLDAHFDLLLWNRAATAVFGDFARIPADHRNVLRMLFGERLRALIVNWEANARFVLGSFRTASSGFVDEPWFVELVRDLSDSSLEFRLWWERYDVAGRPVLHKEIAHPLVGRLLLEQTALQLEEAQGHRVILYTPAPGSDSAAKLRRLALRPEPATGPAGRETMLNGARLR